MNSFVNSGQSYNTFSCLTLINWRSYEAKGYFDNNQLHLKEKMSNSDCLVNYVAIENWKSINTEISLKTQLNMSPRATHRWNKGVKFLPVTLFEQFAIFVNILRGLQKSWRISPKKVDVTLFCRKIKMWKLTVLFHILFTI